MSWMDSWSRPSKHQATPAPFYLHPNGNDVPYCKSCGRVISSRRTDVTKKSTAGQEIKYCSSRCRSNKPGRVDREIEAAFVRFLAGEEELPGKGGGGMSSKAKGKGKGDKRAVVPCDVVEQHVFGGRREEGKVFRRREEGKVFRRRKNWASRVIVPGSDTETDTLPTHISTDTDGTNNNGDRVDGKNGWNRTRDDDDNNNKRGGKRPDSGVDLDIIQSLDIITEDEVFPRAEPKAKHDGVQDGDRVARLAVRSGTRIRPQQQVSEVNGSIGGEKGWAERIEETEAMREKREEGQRRALEREMVRGAARRGVIFGFLLPEGHADEGDGIQGKGENRRKCEAVMQGKVVEPSFAKGDWGIRWREE